MKKAIYTLLFPLAAYIILLLHADYLHAVAEGDMFIGGQAFFEETLRTPGGFWTWIGCFLTQFFTYPWLGALILVAIWTATYIMLTDAFRLKGWHSLLAWIPLFALLVSVIDIGYWLYYIMMPGYWFSQSVSFFAAVLTTWIIVRLVRLVWKKDIAWIVFIIVYFAMMQQFPVFHHRNYDNHLLQLPFIVAPVSVVLLSLIRLVKWQPRSKWATEITTFTALAVFSITAYLLSFRNANFHAEIRMQSALEAFEWDKVIEEAQAAKNPTNLMVVFKNIALMHTDRMPEMFKNNNCGSMPETGDSLIVRTAQIAGPLVYYYFGQINYAYRRAMENNVQYRLQARNMKMMARCAIMNHEFDLAAKYLTILSKSTFNKSWVREYEPMLRFADNLHKSKDFQFIAPLLNEDINTLDIDNSMPVQWILNHFADLINTKNRKQDNIALCTSLWVKDEYAFCIQFYNYSKNYPGEPTPELYQQAALLLGRSEDSPINLDNFPFDQLILDRFDHFNSDYASMSNMGIPLKEIGTRMRDVYGDTYWWYYYFGDFKAY